MVVKLPRGHRVPNTCQGQGCWRSLRSLWYLALPPVLSPNGPLPLPRASVSSRPWRLGLEALILNGIGTYFST